METPIINVDPDLSAMMSSVFAAYRQREDSTKNRATWTGPLWTQLADLGLTRLTGPESAGGSGAGWAEAAALLTAAVRYAVRIPIAEHDLLACWLLDTAGIDVDDARRTVGILDETGTAYDVPWGLQADKIVTVWKVGNQYLVADVECSHFDITPGTNSAGEPRDTVNIDTSALAGIPVSQNIVHALYLRSALVRTIQLCATLERITELAIEHCNTRLQFGRPLSKFQAVQHLVADIAAETSLARAATDAAVAAALHPGADLSKLQAVIAIARSCTGHASTVAVRNAHQVHGAIGTTREHPLHEYTNAALAWRSEYGSVRQWDEVLTTMVLSPGSPNPWSLITADLVHPEPDSVTFAQIKRLSKDSTHARA